MTVVVTVCLWNLVYSPTRDPKGLPYLLWKLGLPTIDPNIALGIMTGDSGAGKLVKGLTTDQLRKRFGHVNRDDLTPYQRYCKEHQAPLGDVAFLGDSNWMVKFEGGVVVDLVLCKGL